MEQKIYFSYKTIHKTVEKISRMIIDSDYNPDIIVAIGTGGFIPARILKTYLRCPVLTVGIKYYDDRNKPMVRPKKIQWIDKVERKIKDKKILLVDEIDDTRITLAYCLGELLRHKPQEIAIAVIHLKQKIKSGQLPEQVKRYYIGSEIPDHWVVYPWDAKDIDLHEKMCEDQS